jgi:hypothetical protein
VVRRQLDFYRDNLPDGRHRHAYTFAAPGHQDTATANVLRVHSGTHPYRGRGNVAPELDIDTRTLTPVDVFHFIPRQAEFRSPNASLSIQQMGYTGILPKVITGNSGQTGSTASQNL